MEVPGPAALPVLSSYRALRYNSDCNVVLSPDTISHSLLTSPCCAELSTRQINFQELSSLVYWIWFWKGKSTKPRWIHHSHGNIEYIQYLSSKRHVGSNSSIPTLTCFLRYIKINTILCFFFSPSVSYRITFSVSNTYITINTAPLKKAKYNFTIIHISNYNCLYKQVK